MFNGVLRFSQDFANRSYLYEVYRTKTTKSQKYCPNLPFLLHTPLCMRLSAYKYLYPST